MRRRENLNQRRRHHFNGRRDFFKQAVLLGAVALTAQTVGSRPVAAGATPPAGGSKQSRYRLTDHIRTYYERASI